MKKRIPVNLICLWTAIALFITGICFDINQADSVSACNLNSNFFECVLSEPVAILAEDACTSEMLGQKTVTNLSGAQEQKAGKSVFLFQLPSVSGEISSSFKAIGDYCILNHSHRNRHSSSIITHYIHIQDGQKD